MKYRPHAIKTKTTVIVDPAPDNTGLLESNIHQLSSSSPMNFPLHDLLYQALLRLPAYTRRIANPQTPFALFIPSINSIWSEGEAQEVKADMLVVFPSAI
jgi:hypothetical protein